MNQQFFSPHPALKGFVNNIMISQVDFDPSKPKPVFPFPPLPEHCLFFYPWDNMDVEDLVNQKKETLPSCTLVGPMSNRINIILGHHHLVIKVGFQPGGLHRLLSIPMKEFLDAKAVDAKDLFGNELNTVSQQLKDATSFYQMKIIVEQYLLKKIKKLKESLPIDNALTLLIKKGGLTSIDYLASTACLSNRQFERVFKERIGLSPKFFSRLVRFANAWVIKENKSDTSWLSIAHTCGYYDQMHLIRDFKEFTATNPSHIDALLQQTPISLQNRIFY